MRTRNMARTPGRLGMIVRNQKCGGIRTHLHPIKTKISSEEKRAGRFGERSLESEQKTDVLKLRKMYLFLVLV